MFRELPREVQYIVLGFVGWHHADPNELKKAVRLKRGRRTAVVPVSTNVRHDYYRYAIPRWCHKCGEYREHPSLKCVFCAHIYYELVGWGTSYSLHVPVRTAVRL